MLVGCLVVCCFLAPLSSFASSGEASIVLTHDVSGESLGDVLYYGFENGEQLAVSDVESVIDWRPLENSQDLSLGFGKEPLWVKFSFSRTTPEKWLLAVPYHALNAVSFFAVKDNEVISSLQLGSDLLFSQRAIDHRYYIFELPEVDSADICIRVEATGAMYVPLRVFAEPDFLKHTESHFYLHGLYLGVMVAMALYNLFLFLAIREKIYLIYIGYIVSYALLLQANEGFGFQFLWPNWPGFNLEASPLFACVAGFFSLLFTIKFLDTERYVPYIHQVLKIALVGCVLFAMVIAAVDYDFNVVMNALSMVFTVAIIFACVQSLKVGCEQAKIFIVAWLLLLVGIFVFAGAINGMLPLNVVTRHALQIGSIAEVLLFSLALANRINIVKSEKQMVMTMQQQALQGLKQAEQEIYDIAFKDRLTGLPNREQMVRNLSKRLAVENQSERLHLFLIHIKQLQSINKALGYKVGDDLLVRVALMLRKESEKWLAGNDLEIQFDSNKDLGALEGANFVLMVKTINDVMLEKLSQKIVSLFEKPITYGELSVDVSVCVGYSPITENEKDFDALLKNAQVAVEAALEKGLDFICYSESLDPYSEKRITLLADLRNAIKQDELQLFLQPKMDMPTQKISGFEALVRWRHPKHGNVSPAEFIPLAEKSGVINDLTEWVIYKALEYTKFFNERSLFPHISVNISAKNLHQPYFAEQVVQTLKRKEIDPKYLVLEITETAMMADPDKALSSLHFLSRQGFKISLDDFGTGYSSLSYLSRLPISEIKIDRSFVKDIEMQETPVIVETTLNMAKGLNLVAVAEGIENEDALVRLQALGCEIAQGFFIAKPMPFDELIAWLSSQQGFESLRFYRTSDGERADPA